MSEIKPCPHCGCKAVVNEQGHTWNGLRSCDYRVACMGCGITTISYDTKEDAVAAWNRRADGWIAVEDGLPCVEDELVLALVTGKPHKSITLHSAYMLAEYNADDGWIVNEYPDWEDAEVTHWQPLPSPPEPKG